MLRRCHQRPTVPAGSSPASRRPASTSGPLRRSAPVAPPRRPQRDDVADGERRRLDAAHPGAWSARAPPGGSVSATATARPHTRPPGRVAPGPRPRPQRRRQRRRQRQRQRPTLGHAGMRDLPRHLGLPPGQKVKALMDAGEVVGVSDQPHSPVADVHNAVIPGCAQVDDQSGQRGHRRWLRRRPELPVRLGQSGGDITTAAPRAAPRLTAGSAGAPGCGRGRRV